MTPIKVGDRNIGPGAPCFVIAEAGVNHNGDPDLALRLVDAAADAGADAVKFQTFTADQLATSVAPKADYQRRTTGADESQLEMLRRFELPRESYQRLMRRCNERRIMFMSTPFDHESADWLVSAGMMILKVPSGELTNRPFLQHLARMRLPMLMSTGMASLGDVDAAVSCVRSAGAAAIALLHCVSSYPTAPADANLRAMGTMARAFDVPTGFSDHTVGLPVPLAAVALGASIIEKHLTLDRQMNGPDHAASSEPAAFSELVGGIRTVELALGDGRKLPTTSELNTAAAVRRSLVAACDLAAGTELVDEHVVLRRPGTGLPLSALALIVGRVTRCEIRAGELLRLDMLA